LHLDEKVKAEVLRVSETYPFRIPDFYLRLIRADNPDCPILRQAIPSLEELKDEGFEDPLGEKESLVTPAFIRKYPGRGVFLVSNRCAMYCRFCNRKRIIGKEWNPKPFWDETLSYIATDNSIREVILSGGDPFMLVSEELEYIISSLRKVPRIGIVRVSTRMPVVYPSGLEDGHFAVVERYSPLWIVVHVNHPRELTPEFYETIRRLKKADATVVSQTVLLRGVNDCHHVLLNLFESLVQHGIKPYYLFQLDEVRGATHFKVRLKKGIEIMKSLRQNASGLAMPNYVLDITGGSGKVPVDHGYYQQSQGTRLHLEGLMGNRGVYTDNGEESRCMKCGICSDSQRAL
jgi:lysine 2,3-aminomutase